MMERPLKRPRLSLGPEHDPEAESLDLQEARAQNDLRLKSIFEGIFAKYGRDFTEVGDEIDLQTGEVVVNNGHIHGMDDEGNAGEVGDWLSDQVSESSVHQAEVDIGASDDDWEGQAGDYAKGRNRQISILSQLRLAPDNSEESLADEATNALSDTEDDRSSVDSLLDTALNVQNISEGLAKQQAPSETDWLVTEKANLGSGGPIQSEDMHVDGLREVVEPTWRVPEISGKFSTPTVARSRPKPTINTVRSQSPPGQGSLWALPSRKARRNTDVTKSKSKNIIVTTQNRKHRSSPIMCDWSFAETPNGSESDDPLQEEYAPSPTPKSVLYIRTKRQGPFTANRAQDKCGDRKKPFSHTSFISRLQTNAPKDQHSLIDLENRLDMNTDDSTVGSYSSAKISHTRSVDTSKFNHGSSQVHETEQDSTPAKSRRVRTVIEPEDAREIIKMKHVQGMQWKDILHHFPHKTLAQLKQWNRIHWIDRLANPPRSSKPWSEIECEKMESLKDKAGLTWTTIRAELPGRANSEIEFELLRLWAGDVNSIQTSGSIGSDDPQGEQEATEAKYSPSLQRVSGADRHEHKESEISTTTPHHGPVTAVIIMKLILNLHQATGPEVCALTNLGNLTPWQL